MILAILQARMSSTRLPGKVLRPLAGALEAMGPAEHMMRLTGDCPLLDWGVIDGVIERHLETGADYTANTWGKRTFPRGLDADIVKSEVLIQAAAEATDPYEREHVLPFIYRRPERYRLEGYAQARDEGELRWTVDLPEDFDFASAVYDALHPANPAFSSDDVRSFLAGRPGLADFGGYRRI